MLRQFTGWTLLAAGLLVMVAVVAGTANPYHAFVHTGHQHVEYESAPVEPGDADALRRHDVVGTHVEATRRLDAATVRVRDGRELHPDYPLDDVRDGTTVEGDGPGGLLPLTRYDFLRVEGEWYRPVAAGNDTVRFEGVDTLAVARAVAVPVDGLPPDARKRVAAVVAAEGGVLVSSPERPDQLLVRTDDGVVRVGRPLCYDCGVGGPGRAISSFFLLCGLLVSVVGASLVATAWLDPGESAE